MSTRTPEQHFAEAFAYLTSEEAQADLSQLLSFTEDCRVDLHEPDNQSLDLLVYGDRFDNAHGNEPLSGERVLALEKTVPSEDPDDDSEYLQYCYLNAATALSYLRSMALVLLQELPAHQPVRVLDAQMQPITARNMTVAEATYLKKLLVDAGHLEHRDD